MRILILTFILFLNACSQKTSFVRDNINSDSQKFDDIIIFVDYLHLVDDIGRELDFHEEINIGKNDALHNAIQNHLIDLGYQINPITIQSSGIYLNPEIEVEHYRYRKLQDFLINPPFFIKSNLVNDQSVSGFTSLMRRLLSSLNPEIVDRGERSQNYLHSLDYSEHIPQGIGNSAILVIQVSENSISAAKGLGFALLSIATNRAPHVGVGYNFQNSKGKTTAFLVHAKTGKLLWSDYRYTGMSELFIHRLFNDFPK